MGTSHLPQSLHLTSSLLQHPLLVLLCLSDGGHTGAVLLRLNPQPFQFLQLLLLLRRRRYVLCARHGLDLLPNLLEVQVLRVQDGRLLIRQGGRGVLVLDGGRVGRGGAACPLCEVDRQRRGAFLLLGLLDRHLHGRVVVLEAREAVAPEVPRSLVAAVDLLCVCQV